jgi:outer membrane protein assembly factor BamB
LLFEITSKSIIASTLPHHTPVWTNTEFVFNCFVNSYPPALITVYENIVFVSELSRVIALDANNGTTLWVSSDFNATILQIALSNNGTWLYVIGSSNVACLYSGLDMANITDIFKVGRLLWSYTLPDQVGFHTISLNTMAVDSNDNIIVFGTQNLYSFNSLGHVNWIQPLSVPGWHPLSLALDANDNIFLGDTYQESQIFSFSSAGESLWYQ